MSDKVSNDRTEQKLVASVLARWESHGTSGISARSVALAAGVQVSAIYYHFGDLGRLLETAQEQARSSATDWCDKILEMVDDVSGPAAIAPLLAAAVDEWCEQQRTLAFAWREAQLMALRNPSSSNSAALWAKMWRKFWSEICNRLGLSDMADLTTWMFEGLCAVHLIRWRRMTDRVSLDELCHGWGSWMEGKLGAAGDWFEAAQCEVDRMVVPQEYSDDTAYAVAEAAAHVVSRNGAAALTHRSVAAEAGLSLGIVSYKFRTSANLLQAAYDTIYRRLLNPPTGPKGGAITDKKQIIHYLRNDITDRTDLLPIDELMLASARDPALQAFAVPLRYLRGRNWRRDLLILAGPEREISAIDGAIMSALDAARSRAWWVLHNGSPPVEPYQGFDPLLKRLQLSGTSR